MRIKTIPKRIFGRNEEFIIQKLLYDNGDDRFRRQELKTLLEVFKAPKEYTNKLILEDFEYQIMREYFNKNSIDLFYAKDILVLNIPKIKNSKFIFRYYDNFSIWFLKLDEDHLITYYEFPCEYGHTDYFVFKHKLYRIQHCLNYDLVDDYPCDALENLTNIIKKDKLIVFLKCLKRQHGEPIYVEYFDDEEEIAKFLDYMYPDIGGDRFLEIMKKNLQDKKLSLDNAGDWDINDVIRFLYLSKKFYKQLKKEV